MNTFAINIDLITGWFPTTVVIVAIASVVLSVGWHDGAWKWELPIGIPVSFGLTLLTALAIHIFNLVPDEFPTSFYLWAWLIWYSVVIIVLGWTRAHWVLRTFSVLALVFCIIAAFTVVNQTFDYYPTLARLFGKDAANFANLPQLKAIRTETRKSGKLPDHGETISLPIPGTVSKFHTNPAFVYLPPVWFKSPEPQLPVVELIAGIPGQPSDWTRAGYADTTSTAFAEQHHGVAPILVIPDNNGNSQDTECSNSSMGNAETYLTTDVPNFMQANFNAAVGKHSLAIAGLSDGGTCATMLALRNPQVFQTFASYSGYNVPTYLNDDAQQTIATLYGGSKANYDAHSPSFLLTSKRFPGLAGWFTAGQSDPGALAPARQLADLAQKAGFEQVCLTTPPGTHSFTFWAQAFKDSLPWLSWHLGLTPPPADLPGHCEPPVP
jgi:S-formylglutathione hydrolase FrmB